MSNVYDVAIIGGGYWGRAIAQEVQRAGKTCVIVDDGDRLSGSRAASGICDPAVYKSSVFRRYMPQDWSESDLQESLHWLCSNHGRQVKEYFWNKFAGTDPREGASCIYFPPVHKLSRLWPAETVKGIAGYCETTKLGRISLAVFNKHGNYQEQIRSCFVVIAAGYRSGYLAEKLVDGCKTNVDRLYGRGIIRFARRTETVSPISVMIRPYCKHTIREWGKGVWKIGDTAEEKHSDNKFNALLDVANIGVPNYRDQIISEGYRPVMDKFTVAKLTNRVILASGGHRVALGLSGLVAKKVLEMLK